jgi:hypothetical protein
MYHFVLSACATFLVLSVIILAIRLRMARQREKEQEREQARRQATLERIKEASERLARVERLTLEPKPRHWPLPLPDAVIPPLETVILTTTFQGNCYLIDGFTFSHPVHVSGVYVGNKSQLAGPGSIPSSVLDTVEDFDSVGLGMQLRIDVRNPLNETIVLAVAARGRGI